MRTRVVLLATLFFTYFLSYVSRKSLIFLTPHLSAERFGATELGLATSAFAVTYGVCKPLSNIVTAKIQPRWVLFFGVLATGILSLAAGLLKSLESLWWLWAVNGAVCGMIWAPIACLIISEFPTTSRGKVWSLCSSSMNVGSTLVPVIVEALAVTLSWDQTFCVIGLANIATSFIVLLVVPGTQTKTSKDTTSSSPSQPWPWAILIQPLILCHCAVKFFITFSIMAMSTWGQLYFLSRLNIDSPLAAGLLMSSYELGGFVGQTASGFVADFITNSHLNSRNNGRAITGMVFVTLGCVAAAGIKILGDTYTVCQLMVFVYGFGMYGFTAMSGLIIREFAPAEFSWMPLMAMIMTSQVGGVLAGAPLSSYQGDWIGLITATSPFILGLLVVMVRCDGRYKNVRKTD